MAEVRHGDCLDVLTELKPESARLAYLDPPFFTQKTHKLATRDRTRQFSFDDLWRSHEEYAEFLYERLTAVRRVLTPDASVFFHCDRRASHIARIILDKVFGEKYFRSEVIWHYRRWSNSQRTLLPGHQTLYFYSKGDSYVFNQVYNEYSPSTNVDQILQRRKRDPHGKPVYQRDESGCVVSADAKKGVPLSDVWDIPYLNPKAKERVGYPTQKPVLLLERIIQLATNAGDLVVDPFCGSGTTLVAASLLGRASIGIDISEEAVALTKDRLANPVRTRSPLLENGRESYRQADEFALAVLSDLDCVPVHRNKGIDAILVENYRHRPVPVRVQRPSESIRDAAASLFRAGQSKHAEMMILVMTQHESEASADSALPPKVVAVQSTSAQVAKALGKVRSRNVQMTLFKADA